ncbi:MAG TPA: hypothetical protein VFA40_09005 [Terriglobales bacterium]|nr:hypothetical protein [Terriglobales bacterium]
MPTPIELRNQSEAYFESPSVNPWCESVINCGLRCIRTHLNAVADAQLISDNSRDAGG